MEKPFTPSITRYLHRKEAAKYLTEVCGIPTSYKTLNKLASTGGGPRYHRSGGLGGGFARYSVDELSTYAKAKLGPLRESANKVADQQPEA